MNVVEVTLENIDCLCVKSENGISGSKVAFDKLESSLSTLKGRKFYGAVLDNGQEYRACVAIQEGDDVKKLGLENYVIPGGKYLRAIVANWPQNLDKIGAAFDEMAKKRNQDKSRPSIEFYRSQKELILFMPVN